MLYMLNVLFYVGALEPQQQPQWSRASRHRLRHWVLVFTLWAWSDALAHPFPEHLLWFSPLGFHYTIKQIKSLLKTVLTVPLIYHLFSHKCGKPDKHPSVHCLAWGLLWAWFPKVQNKLISWQQSMVFQAGFLLHIFSVWNPRLASLISCYALEVL